jgi:hypothetical protein
MRTNRKLIRFIRFTTGNRLTLPNTSLKKINGRNICKGTSWVKGEDLVESPRAKTMGSHYCK